MSNYMELSSYYGENKRADVIKCVSEDRYGVKFFVEDNSLGIEWYDGKSEAWAEDVAENWVEGIKETPVFSN
jgi:hypothetical protein